MKSVYRTRYFIYNEFQWKILLASVVTIRQKLYKYLRWRTVIRANKRSCLWHYRDEQELSREFTFDWRSFGGSSGNQSTIEARVERRAFRWRSLATAFGIRSHRDDDKTGNDDGGGKLSAIYRSFDRSGNVAPAVRRERVSVGTRIGNRRAWVDTRRQPVARDRTRFHLEDYGSPGRTGCRRTDTVGPVLDPQPGINQPDRRSFECPLLINARAYLYRRCSGIGSSPW